MAIKRTRLLAVIRQSSPYRARFNCCSLVALVVISAALLLAWVNGHALLTSSNGTISYHSWSQVGQSINTVDDMLLKVFVEQCALRQDKFLAVQSTKTGWHVATFDTPTSSNHSQHGANCPLVHVLLAAGDRSIGLCTDAGLYVQLLSAWVVPDTQRARDWVQSCGSKSAAMFLEHFCESWLQFLQRNKRIYVAYAPNFEHVFGYDREAHQRVQLVLCKVHRCLVLMQRYLRDIGNAQANLLYTGHTSLDPQALMRHPQEQHSPGSALPSVSAWLGRLKHPAAVSQLIAVQQQPALTANSDHSTASGDMAGSLSALHSVSTSAVAVTQPPVVLAAGSKQLSALHVRGKSSLKHTKELLECWLVHPQWPQLTVVGPMPNEQISLQDTKRYMAAGNVNLITPSKASGPAWPEFDPIAAEELAELLLSHPVHIMPSEREGFGHSINEGRAAGAVLVVPDHPPMDELVRQGSGVYINPHMRFSHIDQPVPVLGNYGYISVSVTPQGICAAVAQALALTPEQRLSMGSLARKLHEADRQAFELSMQRIRQLLQGAVAIAQASGNTISNHELLQGSPVP